MQIENKIKSYIFKKLFFAEDNLLNDDDSFLETGVVDSTGVMELVAFVPAEFGVPVDPAEIAGANFHSLRKVAQFIRRKLAVPEKKTAPAARPLPATPSTAVNY